MEEQSLNVENASRAVSPSRRRGAVAGILAQSFGVCGLRRQRFLARQVSFFEPDNRGTVIDSNQELVIGEEEDEFACAGALVVADRHGIDARLLQVGEQFNRAMSLGGFMRGVFCSSVHLERSPLVPAVKHHRYVMG